MIGYRQQRHQNFGAIVKMVILVHVKKPNFFFLQNNSCRLNYLNVFKAMIEKLRVTPLEQSWRPATIIIMHSSSPLWPPWGRPLHHKNGADVSKSIHTALWIQVRPCPSFLAYAVLCGLSTSWGFRCAWMIWASPSHSRKLQTERCALLVAHLDDVAIHPFHTRHFVIPFSLLASLAISDNSYSFTSL